MNKILFWKILLLVFGPITLLVIMGAIVLSSVTSIENSRFITGLLIIASFLSAGFVFYLYEHFALSPLRKFIKKIKQNTPNEINFTQTTKRDDEIGQLEQGLQSLVHSYASKIKELETEQDKLDAVINQMTDGVIIVDRQGIVILINSAAQQIFNIPVNGYSNLSISEALRSHQLVKLWEKCQETGEQQALTIETAPDRLFIEAIATPLSQTNSGQIMITIQDLTRVRRLETVRRDFVSNVSHELRTPLASLKSLIDTLEDGAIEDPPAAQRFLNRMNIEVDNMTQMVQELLELSRIESGKVPLELKSVSPKDIISPVIDRMQLQIERAGLTFTYIPNDSLHKIVVDKTRIQQVLMNLIHNAIKFTPPGGKIFITTRQEKNHLVFSVKDSGVGIKPEDLERIFERFYKADRARSGGGTGLGLSIARHLVEAHGGKIWVESTPSIGSTFSFSLPINKNT